MTTTQEAISTLKSLRARIPVEGIWFDLERSDQGSRRVYWIRGQIALQIVVSEAPTRPGAWLALVMWTPGNDGMPAKHEFGPFVHRETAEQVALAASIGVQVAQPARHISQIPGVEISIPQD